MAGQSVAGQFKVLLRLIRNMSVKMMHARLYILSQTAEKSLVGLYRKNLQGIASKCLYT